MGYIVETLQLNGEDACNFARILYRPSIEMMEKNKNNLDLINNSISITRNGSDFNAEIEDLDLSFLDEISNQIFSNINTTIIALNNMEYYSNDNNSNSVTIKVKKEAVSSIFAETDNIFSLAA